MAARTYDSRGITVSVDGLGDFGAANGMVAIPGITAITGPGFSASEHDVTDTNSNAKERRPGLPDYGEVSLTAFDNPGSISQRVLRKMGADQAVRAFEIDVEQRDIQVAATTATIRGITIAAPSGANPARVTFAGTGFGSSLDIRKVSRLAPGTVIVSGSVAYTIGEHQSASMANITRLDGATVTAVTSAATYKIVRPKAVTEFSAYVSSMSQTFGVDARNTVEISLMVDGEITTTLSAT